MATKKIPIWDTRMLELMDWCIFKKKVENQKDFLFKIGFPNHNNVKQVKEGKQSFRHEHLYTASKLFNISMEWFYGFDKTKERQLVKPTALSLLKQAINLMDKR